MTKLRDVLDLRMTEREFQALVVDFAHLEGWQTYHTHDSRRSDRGWPDLALVRPPRLLLAELKTQRGRVRPDQQIWLRLLSECNGVETYLWRPSDWPEIEATLRRRQP